MKRLKNNLDEMQEQKLLRIEHNGFWLAFWGLMVLIVSKTLFLSEVLGNNTLGESVLFLSLCVYILYACIKNGIWDRRLKPDRKGNIFVSTICSVATGVLIFISSYSKYGKLYGSVASGVIVSISTFVLAMILLTFSSILYKKRVQSLEENIDEKSK